MSSGTSFSSCSQAKKLSPASPDQSVPSQSKTATLGFRLRIESIKAWARSAILEGDTSLFPVVGYSDATWRADLRRIRAAVLAETNCNGFSRGECAQHFAGRRTPRGY